MPCVVIKDREPLYVYTHVRVYMCTSIRMFVCAANRATIVLNELEDRSIRCTRDSMAFP